MRSAIGVIVAIFAGVGLSAKELECEGARTRYSSSEIRSKVEFTLSTKRKALRDVCIERTYRYYCAHCHGLDGRPRSLVENIMPEIPDFSLAEWADYEPADLFDSVLDGTGQMPAFRQILSKADIEGLAAFMLRLQQGKPDSYIRKRWQYFEEDKKFSEEMEGLRQRLNHKLESRAVSIAKAKI